jgi:hypothetical protein
MARAFAREWHAIARGASHRPLHATDAIRITCSRPA